MNADLTHSGDISPAAPASFRFRLSGACVERLSYLPFPRDFAFVAGDTQYRCSKFSACFFSERVSRLLVSDPTVDSLALEGVSASAFGRLFDLASGREVLIDSDHLGEVYMVCREIENVELRSVIGPKLFEEMSVTNIIHRVKSKTEIGLEVSEEISFLASHFHEFDSAILQTLGPSLAAEVISNPLLVLSSEDTLYDIITSSGPEFEDLLSYLKCQYLSESVINKFVDSLSLDRVTPDLWSSICTRLRLHVNVSHDSPRFAQIGFHVYANQPFNGILHSLRCACGRNPHVAGLVAVTASGSKMNQPHQVLDYDWGDHWSSMNEEDSWIQIDFRKRAVCLSHYALKSHTGTLNFFRHWVLEGSGDGRIWDIIDSRSTDELAGKQKVAVFPANSAHYYRFIRLRQTGKTSHGHNTLILQNLELFGMLQNE
jgi:hypothetical protein